MPIDGSVPYHLHYKVLNAKKHGIPQNRERVFLIGIRDDQDNTFTWPEEEELTHRLKDVLEEEVDDKYFLSELSVNYLLRHNANKDILKKELPNNSSCIPASYYKTPRDCQYIKIGVDNYKIRRLTPRECFRLMDFPDTFTWPVSNSQAYKQAGNSIVVRVLEKIIKNLPL